MTEKSDDFRRMLLSIGKEISSDSLHDLNFYFNRPNPPEDDRPVNLFRYLIEVGIITEKNLSRLIEGLREINLGQVAQKLVQYEARMLDTGLPVGVDFFIGRRQELDDMQFHVEGIRGSNHGFRAVYITGLPGVGKTYLAEEFRRREDDSFFEPIFISCRELDSAGYVRNLLLEKFSISVDRDRPYKILEKTMKTCKNKLIILDNLEDVMAKDGDRFNDLMSNLSDVLRTIRSRSHCFLMTSRRQLCPEVAEKFGDNLLNVRLDKMNESDSLELLSSYLGTRELSLEEKKRLMKLCGQHTLSMALVASRLKHNHHVPFELIADQMKRRPLITLTNMEDLERLESRSCVENSLYNTFQAMSPVSQDLLVRLSRAADSIKEDTAEHLYRDMTCEARDQFSESLVRLMELNFVKCRDTSGGGKPSRRYYIHLLIRSFVDSFCKHPDCSQALKTTYAEAQEMLRLEYIDDMKRLSTMEWKKPRNYSRAVEADRVNYLSEAPHMLDFMIASKCSLNDFDSISDVTRHLLCTPKQMANFLSDRKKHASRQETPSWIVGFLELRYGDSIRLTGQHALSGESFEKVKNLLDSRPEDTTPEQWAWLDAYYDRYYGRYLKDSSSGDFRRALKKAVRYLTEAYRKVQNKDLFFNIEKHMAEVQFDLGNAYKQLGDHTMFDRVSYYNKAREAFDTSRKLCEQSDPRMARLFDIYLSLASCEMELKSLLTSVDLKEDRQSLRPAVVFYDKAEDIATANREIILSDKTRMGILHYSRAICHTRAGEIKSAYADATKALRMRTESLGCHTKTMSCYLLLAQIYSRGHREFVRHNRQALTAAEKALAVAKRLACKGAIIDKINLEELESMIMILSDRLDKDSSAHERTIEAIRRQDLAALGPDTCDNEILSDEDYSDEKTARQSALREYRDSSSDSDAESDAGCAPPCSEARDLSDQIKELMNKNAERLSFLSHVMDEVEMRILCAVLRDGYPNLRPDARNVRYEKGTRLYSQLRRLDENPGAVIEENKASHGRQ